jgi:hypothetical protein
VAEDKTDRCFITPVIQVAPKSLLRLPREICLITCIVESKGIALRVRPSDRMYQRVFHWTDFSEILLWEFVRGYFGNIRIYLNGYKISGTLRENELGFVVRCDSKKYFGFYLRCPIF